MDYSVDVYRIILVSFHIACRFSANSVRFGRAMVVDFFDVNVPENDQFLAVALNPL
jgi:hypothetical protein